MEISNRTLTVLLVITIIVSVGGAAINVAKLSELASVMPAISMLTGMGTAGEVNVSVATLASINVVRTYVDFGVGYVTDGYSSATLNSSRAVPTEWTVSGSTWGAKDLQLYNDGTVDVGVNVSSDKTGATMIGGTSPALKFDAYNNQSNSCSGTANLTTFAAAATNYQVCNNLTKITNRNSLNLSIVIDINEDASPGNKTAALTFTAIQKTA